MRLVIAGLLLLAGHASGTLVVVIPTKDGALIAADSRLTVGRRYVDGVEKIRLVPGRPDMAFFLTGQSEFVPVADMDAPEADLRHLMVQGPKFYSATQIVEQFLRQKKGGELTNLMIQDLARTLGLSLREAVRTRMNVVPLYGKQLFRCVLVSRDAGTSMTRVASVRISLSEVGIPLIDDMRFDLAGPTSRRTALIFGEQKYFEQRVLNGPGRPLVGYQNLQTWNQAFAVADLTSISAARIARGWIGATAELSRTVPIPSGVGGEIRTILLDGRAAPRELR